MNNIAALVATNAAELDNTYKIWSILQVYCNGANQLNEFKKVFSSVYINLQHFTSVIIFSWYRIDSWRMENAANAIFITEISDTKFFVTHTFWFIQARKHFQCTMMHVNNSLIFFWCATIATRTNTNDKQKTAVCMQATKTIYVSFKPN